MITLSFLITSLIVAILPGIGVIFTIHTGLTSGRKNAFFATLGCTLGIIPHLILSILLYGFVLTPDSIVFTIIRYLGTAYLVWIGLSMLRKDSTDEATSAPSVVGSFSIIRKSMLINLLNPKLILFFFSFFPQYIDIEAESSVLQLIVLGSVFILITFFIFLLYGQFAAFLSGYFVKHRKELRITKIVAGLLIIFMAIQGLVQA